MKSVIQAFVGFIISSQTLEIFASSCEELYFGQESYNALRRIEKETGQRIQENMKRIMESSKEDIQKPTASIKAIEGIVGVSINVNGEGGAEGSASGNGLGVNSGGHLTQKGIGSSAVGVVHGVGSPEGKGISTECLGSDPKDLQGSAGNLGRELEREIGSSENGYGGVESTGGVAETVENGLESLWHIVGEKVDLAIGSVHLQISAGGLGNKLESVRRGFGFGGSAGGGEGDIGNGLGSYDARVLKNRLGGIARKWSRQEDLQK